MKLLFNIFIFLLLAAVFYPILGVALTIFYRKKNPLKYLPNDKKVIYLTFDDGINRKYTPQLLDLLKEYNIKATFFVVANFANDNGDILLRMKNEGHTIGLHSLGHKNQILQSPFAVAKDFKESLEIFKKHNIPCVYFRPPWGHVGPATLYFCKKNNLKVVLWNVIVQDWQRDTTPQIICDKLTAKVNGNSVICLHDGRGQNSAPSKTIAALQQIIPLWKGDGYTFETIDNIYKKDFA